MDLWRWHAFRGDYPQGEWNNEFWKLKFVLELSEFLPTILMMSRSINTQSDVLIIFRQGKVRGRESTGGTRARGLGSSDDLPR